MSKIKFFIVFLLLFFPIIILAKDKSPELIAPPQLKDTIITAYLPSPIIPGKNQIFCSTFQIAWDILSDTIIKEPLQLSGHPEMEIMLNKRLTGSGDISKDCYLAMAGFNRDNIIDKIKEALKNKFNEKIGIDIKLDSPDDILAYAFLLKDLKFAKEFESFTEPLLFNNVAVSSFGIKKYVLSKNYMAIGQQVKILDYINDDDFILQLQSVNADDEIILAKIKPGNTVLETVDNLLKRIEYKSSTDLEKDDVLQIPKIDFNLLHEYKDIIGKGVLNKGFTDYFISKAIQSIRFRLNENGALLKSEAAIVMSKGVSMSKKLIFNKPFLLCLKEKSAKYPYLVIWIDNTELLMPIKKIDNT